MNDDENIAPLAELLACMVDTLRWSLTHSQQDSGALASLLWVGGFLQCYRRAADSTHEAYRDPLAAIPLTGHPDLRPRFLHILRLSHLYLGQGYGFAELLGLLRMQIEDLPEVSSDFELVGVRAAPVAHQLRTLHGIAVSFTLYAARLTLTECHAEY